MKIGCGSRRCRSFSGCINLLFFFDGFRENSTQRTTANISPPIGAVIHQGENAQWGTLCLSSHWKRGSDEQNDHTAEIHSGAVSMRKLSAVPLTGCLRLQPRTP